MNNAPRPSASISILLLIAITAAVYFPVARYPFVNWDDQEMVTQNPGLVNPSWSHVAEFWTKPYIGLYTPLAYTIWSGVAMIARSDSSNPASPSLDPQVFHIFNLLLHVINVVLVFAILKILTRSSDTEQENNPWAAFVGATIFAVHPLQVEPVVWVSGMNNLLGGSFALATILLYELFARDDRKRKILAVAATITFVLALLSKPTAVVVPFVILAIELLVRRLPRKNFVLPIAWMALTAVFVVVTMMVQPASTIWRPPIFMRPLIAADAIGFYLCKLILPFRLGIDYGRTPQWLIHHGPLSWSWIFPVMVVIAAWIFRKKFPWLLGCVVIFIAALLPVLGLVSFDFQTYSTVADRYAYLAMLGPAIALASVIQISVRWPAVQGAVGLFMIILGVVSFQAVASWRDNSALFARALEVNPHSALSNNVLGYLAASKNDSAEAERRYRLALEIQPNLFSSHYNLANLMLRQQRFNEAVPEYRAAIANVPPGDTRVIGMYNNLGVALARLNRFDEAADAMKKVLELAPTNADAKRNLDRLQTLRDAAPTSRPATP